MLSSGNGRKGRRGVNSFSLSDSRVIVAIKTMPLGEADRRCRALMLTPRFGTRHSSM